MKNKYYTPEIEEFHIGFEFEKYDNRPAIYKENDFKPTNWHKHTYNLTSIRLSQLDTHLYNKTLRVKYLDREDIESCGFDTEDNGECYCMIDTFDLYGLYPWEWDKGIKNLYKITLNRETLYRGVIKNISELKVLLKQLDVYNEK